MRERRPGSVRIRRLLAAAGRLCLLISLWQAPVPVVHAHDDLDPATVSEPLQRHLEQFHPHAWTAAAEHLGWHWHWMLPAWCQGTSSDDDAHPTGPERGQAVFFDAGTVRLHSADAAAAVAPQAVVTGVAAASAPSPTPRYGDIDGGRAAGQAPACVLLCRSLC